MEWVDVNDRLPSLGYADEWLVTYEDWNGRQVTSAVYEGRWEHLDGTRFADGEVLYWAEMPKPKEG